MKRVITMERAMRTYPMDLDRNALLEKLILVIRSQNAKVRLHFDDGELTEWSQSFSIPTPGYIELAGPRRQAELVLVEIDLVELRHIGRRVPLIKVDHSIELEAHLVFLKDRCVRRGTVFEIKM